MKKHIRILAVVLLIFSLSGCADVQIPEVPEGDSPQTMSAVSSAVERPASSSDSKKSDVFSKAPAAPTERPKSTPKPAEKSKKSARQDSPIIPPKQSSTEEPKMQVRAQATVPPASSTPAPTPVPTPVPTPIPTPEPPLPTPEPVELTPEPVQEPSFDIGYWVGYAQSYATGVGLTLEGSAVDCWDNPIPAGAHCNNIEGDIQSRLNRYANDPDITDVWIWHESAGGGSYNIYIGYA